MDATPTVDLLDETWSSIIDLGHQLSPEDWELPTDCPGWTVKDVASHVIGTERFLQGLPPADADPGERPHVRNPLGAMNEREVEARRGRSGAEVLAELEEVVALRLSTLRAGDDAYFAQDALTPTGPGTLLDFLNIRVLDCWVHEQDMRRAVGRPGHVDCGAAQHTIDRMLRTVPMVVGKRAAAPDGATVVLELTGPVERTVGITVEGGRAKIVDSVPAPDVRLAMDSETYVVLANGREPASARADQVSIEGDQALGQAIVGNLNTMI
jgi:uncharacterized protein (TIGR03083 family)